MYTNFFGLRELPFNNTPDPRYFYATRDHEEALASLVYAVQERKGFVLLTGEIGAGKTLASRMMLQHFETRIAYATINHAPGGGDLLESICTEFELPLVPGTTHTQLVRLLHDFLLAKYAQDVPVVLVLDEAQTLSVDAFEQIRMIGNLEADDAKLLQVAIFGQPELQRTFASPALRQLRQRIFRSFHLPALSPEETEGYIRHRLTVAGANTTDFFDAEAIAKIYDYSRGLPRIINTLCDNAMLSGYSVGQRAIGGAVVESVVQKMMALGDAGSGGLEHGAGAPPWAIPQTVRTLHPFGVGQGHEPSGYRGYDPKSLTAPYAVPNTHEHVSDRHILDAVQNEIDLFGRNLRSSIEQVHRRLETVEEQLAGNHGGVSEAQAAHDRLKPLVAQVGSLTRTSKINIEELTKCNASAQELATKMRRAIDDVRRIFDELNRAAARTQYAERDGRKIYDRLVAQTDRAKRTGGKLEHMAERIAREFAVRKTHLSTILKAASKPVVDSVHLPTVAPDTSRQGRFQEMLEGSRQSLSNLRTFVQGNGGCRSGLPEPDHDAPKVRDSLIEKPPVQRLLGEVDRLADMVDSDAASAPSA